MLPISPSSQYSLLTKAQQKSIKTKRYKQQLDEQVRQKNLQKRRLQQQQQQQQNNFNAMAKDDYQQYLHQHKNQTQFRKITKLRSNTQPTQKILQQRIKGDTIDLSDDYYQDDDADDNFKTIRRNKQKRSITLSTHSQYGNDNHNIGNLSNIRSNNKNNNNYSHRQQQLQRNYSASKYQLLSPKTKLQKLIEKTGIMGNGHSAEIGSKFPSISPASYSPNFFNSLSAANNKSNQFRSRYHSHHQKGQKQLNHISTFLPIIQKKHHNYPAITSNTTIMIPPSPSPSLSNNYQSQSRSKNPKNKSNRIVVPYFNTNTTPTKRNSLQQRRFNKRYSQIAMSTKTQRRIDLLSDEQDNENCYQQSEASSRSSSSELQNCLKQCDDMLLGNSYINQRGQLIKYNNKNNNNKNKNNNNNKNANKRYITQQQNINLKETKQRQSLIKNNDYEQQTKKIDFSYKQGDLLTKDYNLNKSNRNIISFKQQKQRLKQKQIQKKIQNHQLLHDQNYNHQTTQQQLKSSSLPLFVENNQKNYHDRDFKIKITTTDKHNTQRLQSNEFQNSHSSFYHNNQDDNDNNQDDNNNNDHDQVHNLNHDHDHDRDNSQLSQNDRQYNQQQQQQQQNEIIQNGNDSVVINDDNGQMKDEEDEKEENEGDDERDEDEQVDKEQVDEEQQQSKQPINQQEKTKEVQINNCNNNNNAVYSSPSPSLLNKKAQNHIVAQQQQNSKSINKYIKDKKSHVDSQKPLASNKVQEQKEQKLLESNQPQPQTEKYCYEFDLKRDKQILADIRKIKLRGAFIFDKIDNFKKQRENLNKK